MMWSSGLEKGCGRFICTSPHGFRVLFCTIHSAVLLFPELKITELKANRIRFVIEISRLSLLGFSALLPCFAPMRLKILSILLSTVCPGPWLYWLCPQCLLSSGLASLFPCKYGDLWEEHSKFIRIWLHWSPCWPCVFGYHESTVVSSVETDLIPP